MMMDISRNVVFSIEYEWLTPSFKNCRVFGHKTDLCEQGPRCRNVIAIGFDQAARDQNSCEQDNETSDMDLGGRYTSED